MKKLSALFSLGFILFAGQACAQLAPGATAPDFTFTDTKGNSHNLYSYLNQGKYIAIDIFATWCSPCWAYHQQHTLDSLETIYGDKGLKTWKIFQIEGDDGTDAADLNGTGSNTEGDWMSGVDYATIDIQGAADVNKFSGDFDIIGFPTLYLIGPNKKVYEMFTLTNYQYLPYVSTWEQTAKDKFGFTPVGIDEFSDANPLTLYPNPASGTTNLYFHLNQATNLKISVSNVMGQVVSTKDLGLLAAGDQNIAYDLNSLSSGIYYFAVSAENSRSITKKIVVQ